MALFFVFLFLAREGEWSGRRGHVPGCFNTFERSVPLSGSHDFWL
ncbi:MAG: hypothetical protein QGG74_06160 [Phycisphaerales bacterium]|nr:hypothetical protein [Phycisphaerales bacterium]